MTVNLVWKPTESFSWDDGVKRLAVMHITAGATTNANLAPFIQNPANSVSYHYSVDNISGDNLAYNYVNPDSGSSWSCCNFNSVSLNICICASASAVDWSRDEWLANEDHALNCAAALLAQYAPRFGIPLVALTASQAQGGTSGVCQHRDLGSSGCGHSDCGPNFPMDELLRLAKGDIPAPVTVRGDYMGAIIQNPQSEPVPEYAGSQKRFAISADVGSQGGDPIKVRLAFQYKSQTGYQIVNAVLTTAEPLLVYSTNERSSVSMSVSDGKNVGYSFW